MPETIAELVHGELSARLAEGAADLRQDDRASRVSGAQPTQGCPPPPPQPPGERGLKKLTSPSSPGRGEGDGRRGPG